MFSHVSERISDGKFLFKQAYIPILIESIMLVMEKSVVKLGIKLRQPLKKEDDCDRDVNTLGGESAG